MKRLLTLLAISTLAALTALVTPAAPANAQYASTPNAHIVSIGIDDYAGEYPSFRGAVRDAESLSEALAAGFAPFSGEVRRTLLLDAGATRDSLDARMRSIAAEAGEDDLFVLHFAGHGFADTTDAGVPEHFLILSGARSRADDRLAENRRRSISAQLLNTWLKVIPARNQLVVIDAAYGHQFFFELLTLKEEEAAAGEAASLLTDNLAVFAFEDLAPEIRLPNGRAHGALTYTLLQGLDALVASRDVESDGESGGDRDGVATVLELGDFVMDRYPDVIREHAPEWSLGGRARFFLSGDYFALASTDHPLAVRAARSLFGNDATRLARPIAHASRPLGPDPSGVRVERARVRPPAFMANPDVGYTLRGRVSPDVDELTVDGRSVQPSYSGEFFVPLTVAQAADSITLVARSGAGETSLRLAPQISARGAARPGAARPDPSPRNGRDVALIFATGEYDNWSQLTNPSFDAEALNEELSDRYGFDVTVVRDASRREMLDSLNAFASRDIGEDGQLLVFFAGHGSYDETYIQDGFVVASDSDVASSDTYKDTMVQYNWIRRRLANAEARHVLLVLDVCYGGTFAGELGRSGDRSDDATSLYADVDAAELVARKLKYRTRRYITSGGKERVPDGLPGEHTPFVRRFLEALRGGGGSDGVVTLAEVYAELERVSPEPRAGEFERNEPGSDFVFVSR